MLIDTHCHLTDEGLGSQIEEVLSRAEAKEVGRIIVPSTGLLDGQKAILLASKYRQVWAMVGVHPENIDELRTANYELWEEIKRMVVGNKKVVGIGEIGLDFHHDPEKRSKPRQIELFEEQLKLAVGLNLPVAIHMRDAEEEMKEILQKTKKLPAGQFHCWSGSEEMLRLVLEKGFYVSFCGNITYKSAGSLRGLIKKVPSDRLLLETDSPYLSPEPARSSLNEPMNVIILAEYIANLLGLPTETLINQTTKNAECLYFPG